MGTSCLVQNPIQTLLEHPEHDRLYVDDPIAGALSKPDLKILVDIVLENTPPTGYTVLEMYDDYAKNQAAVLGPGPCLRKHPREIFTIQYLCN
jgi:hypothetical protein